jgi:hypothetical protein
VTTGGARTLRDRAIGARHLCSLAAWYAIFAISRRLVPMPTLLTWAEGRPRRRRRAVSRAVLVGRVLRVSRLARARDRDCVPRSLLFYRELSRDGEAPTLMLGVRRAAAGVEGHAWVVANGAPIADAPAEIQTFTVIQEYRKPSTAGNR